MKKKVLQFSKIKLKPIDQSQNYISGNYGEFDKNKEILILKGNVNLKNKRGLYGFNRTN